MMTKTIPLPRTRKEFPSLPRISWFLLDCYSYFFLAQNPVDAAAYRRLAILPFPLDPLGPTLML